MPTCGTCGHTEFLKESGFFYCEICHTKNEDIREEFLDVRVDLSTKYRKTRIKRLKSVNSGNDLGWTTWELHNFILIGLTNELIQLGATSDIKLTVLQLWATYLGKVDVAFTSTCKKEAPRLAQRFNKRDAEILYGKLRAKRRNKKRKGSNPSTSIISDGTYSTRELNQDKKSLIHADYERFLASQTNSDTDSRSLITQSVYSSTVVSSLETSDEKPRLKFSSHGRQERKRIKIKLKTVPKNRRKIYKPGYVSTLYKTSPCIITPMKLWAIVYLALRIHNESIQLSDMLRYGREGHLSYYKLDHLIPEEIRLNNSYMNFLSPNTEITHKGLRKTITSMANFLKVYDLPSINLLPLVERYCKDLELPNGILLYAKRVFALISPHIKFKTKKPFPNYEGRAMALIVIILKLLFALDGLTESKISKISETMNEIIMKEDGVNSKLFSFNEWQQYIECRKAILTNQHFPTKLKYNPNMIGLKSGYYKFMEAMSSKRDGGFEITSSKHLIPQELVQTMRQCIDKLNENIPPLQEIEVFAPSLTPLSSYLQQFLNNSSVELPSILNMNFSDTKIGYTTKYQSLQKLATQCGIGLDIIDSSAHFIEKIVPPFDTTRMPSNEKLNENVEVYNEDEKISSREKLFQTMPSKIVINLTKQKYFNNIESTDKSKDSSSNHTFDHISSDGKLLIGQKHLTKESIELDLSETEKETLSFTKTNFKANLFYSARVKKYHRNAEGKFIKIDNDCRNNTKQSFIDNTEIFVEKESDSSKDDVIILDDETDTTVRLFRPFKDYWLYHYNFHRVRPIHFELFEKTLPFNFRWLLNECACIIETSTEDLYEEVCAFETHLIGILKKIN